MSCMQEASQQLTNVLARYSACCGFPKERHYLLTTVQAHMSSTIAEVLSQNPWMSEV